MNYDLHKRCLALCAELDRVIIGKRPIIARLVCAMLCGGHVLLEDVPGTGKTTLANTLAGLIGCSFQRIQFTPDVMPSDITGYNVINIGGAAPRDTAGDIAFRRGPIFNQIILADELNRASPKTQSALLEAMQERQVTIDGVTYACPEPFFVIATQNPIEYVGTFKLPEAQLDRFFMRIKLGYPTPEEESEIMEIHAHGAKRAAIASIMTSSDILSLQKDAMGIYAAKPLRDYISNIAAATRRSPDLRLGASTRASIALLAAAKAWAYLRGADYATPADVRSVFTDVLAHRIQLTADARYRGLTSEDILNKIAAAVSVPEA